MPAKYTRATPITPGTPVGQSAKPQLGVGITTEGPGYVGLLLEGGGTWRVYIAVAGTFPLDDIAVSGVDAAASTAPGFAVTVLS